MQVVFKKINKFFSNPFFWTGPAAPPPPPRRPTHPEWSRRPRHGPSDMSKKEMCSPTPMSAAAAPPSPVRRAA
jgi:hypothetical protein